MVTTSMRARQHDRPLSATRGGAQPTPFDNSTALAFDIPHHYRITAAKANKVHPLTSAADVRAKIVMHGLPRCLRVDSKANPAAAGGYDLEFSFIWPDGGARIVKHTRLRAMGLHARGKRVLRERLALGILTPLQKKGAEALSA